MGRYKLIALDMDGTALFKHKLTDENLFWIKKAMEAGIHVCFATGRPIQDASPYIEQLQLETPIVTANGGEVWKRPGELLKRHVMNVESLLKLRELALQHQAHYWVHSASGTIEPEEWNNIDPYKEEWLKIGIGINDSEAILRVRQEVESWNMFEISNSHPHNIEINPKGINKKTGIIEVCQLLQIEMSEVVAMGDSMNDIEMIKAAGLGVAMGNAQEAVKQAADIVTLKCGEDGVAKAIREHVLAEHIAD